jgi:hypothetical protein
MRVQRQCPQCKGKYSMVAPPKPVLLVAGDIVAKMGGAATPVLALVAIGGSLWAGLCAYGAIAIRVAAGPTAQPLLARTAPWRLAVALPLVPVTLIGWQLRFRVRSFVH